MPRRGARIYWQGALVTQANNGGNLSFQGVAPADCVGSLHEGDPAAAINVALANCAPVSGAPAPVAQTGQTQCSGPVADTSNVMVPCTDTGVDSGRFGRACHSPARALQTTATARCGTT